ncbi:MAG: hypothetical protein ACJAVM_000342 [Sulfitobacter sp.]|jgi:hypothetical protein
MTELVKARKLLRRLLQFVHLSALVSGIVYQKCGSIALIHALLRTVN